MTPSRTVLCPDSSSAPPSGSLLWCSSVSPSCSPLSVHYCLLFALRAGQSLCSSISPSCSPLSVHYCLLFPLRAGQSLCSSVSPSCSPLSVHYCSLFPLQTGQSVCSSVSPLVLSSLCSLLFTVPSSDWSVIMVFIGQSPRVVFSLFTTVHCSLFRLVSVCGAHRAVHHVIFSLLFTMPSSDWSVTVVIGQTLM